VEVDEYPFSRRPFCYPEYPAGCCGFVSQSHCFLYRLLVGVFDMMKGCRIVKLELKVDE
jgi:hypothetical protein